MSAEVLTTWGVVLELGEDAADRALDGSRSASRPRPGSRRRGAPTSSGAHASRPSCACSGATLAVSAVRIGPLEAGSYGRGVMVGVSVTEVRPSSFDMAVRIRLAADHDASAASGRCTVEIVRASDGAAIPLPREIRDKFISIQLGARAYL